MPLSPRASLAAFYYKNQAKFGKGETREFWLTGLKIRVDKRPPFDYARCKPYNNPPMTAVYFLLGSILIISGFIAWKLWKKEEADPLSETLDKLRKDIQDSRLKDREHLQERIDHVSKILTDNVQNSAKNMQGQFAQYSKTLKEVTGQLTKLEETNKQVINFSAQLEDLQSILKQPKGKGILSEYWLESLLGHVLQPEQYKMQYSFKNGEIVDAVIFFQEKIIPIDAKFSSEKYNDIAKEKDETKREKMEKEFKNDLKLRIDETSKYIRPSESTTDFAFMFLPAEGIFYDLLVSKVGTVEVNRENLMEYAVNKRVIIASPATFFAYLQTVLQGLKAFKMEESIKDVMKNVEQLGKHINSYDTFMQKMGTNLGTTVNMYNQAYHEFKKIDKDVIKLTDGKAGGKVDPFVLDKPSAHVEEAFEKAAEKQLSEAS